MEGRAICGHFFRHAPPAAFLFTTGSEKGKQSMDTGKQSEIKRPVCTALIAAAGIASRMEGRDKLFCILGDRPVLAGTLGVFQLCPAIDHIVVVARREKQRDIEKLCAQFGITKLYSVVAGGETRTRSVALGLSALPGHTKLVAIHDGARSFVTLEVIEKTVSLAAITGAAAAGVRVKDTLKRTEGGVITDTPDRSLYWSIQTPQVFDSDLIRRAHAEAAALGIEATDDCALVERLGHKVYISEGSYKNIKITTPEDLICAQALLEKGEEPVMKCRIGHGYDVHKLVCGRKLILGGVEIPYDRGLYGHSDADVLVHAVADALLGAAGLGDIGRHFPDTDNQYKGISSLLLLERVAQMVEERGYRVCNIDATIIAQRPKLAGYIREMEENIAQILKAADVNVKATTEEGLGLTGRGEGIAAHSICLLTGK